MSTLAHVFESAGLATVVLASMRGVVEAMQPPRTLFADFPLGRPLGKPNDAAFQRDVLDRAFATLEAPAGPVLVDHPETIEASDTAVSCQIPPAHDATAHPAVAEAQGIRKAYDRTLERRGVSSVGRLFGPDDIRSALEVMLALAESENWKDVEIPGKNTTAIVHDIRTYYEEAALSLVQTPDPDGRALEAWFYEETEAGKLVMAARSAIAAQQGPMGVWFYMAPGHR